MIFMPIGEGIADGIRTKAQGRYAFIANRLLLAVRIDDPVYLAAFAQDPGADRLRDVIRDGAVSGKTPKMRGFATTLLGMWPCRTTNS